MRLRILSSGSVGNCYILEGLTQSLIIECGVPFREIKQALDFNLSKVAGVLVSHEHKDHCKSVNDVINAGLNVYASDGTIAAMKLATEYRAWRLWNKTPKQIGEFSVMGFNVKHDAKEPFGFLIQHPECGKVLFVTDSYYVEYKFPGLNNIIVEANYCSEIVSNRMIANNIHKAVRDRVLESHMSLKTCKELLMANDLSAVNNIVLIHLSEQNSNSESFEQQVKELTGKSVHVAEKNMTIDFNINPF